MLFYVVHLFLLLLLYFTCAIFKFIVDFFINPIRKVSCAATSGVFSDMFDRKYLYNSKLVKLPLPRYLIFYNGLKEEPDRSELNLSVLFSV